MMKQKGRRIAALVLAVSMLVSLPGTAADAKAKVRLNKKKVTLRVGKKVQLKVKGTKKKAVWKSNNKRVAAVSVKGASSSKKVVSKKVTVTAKRKGAVRIIAKIGKKKLECRVLVTGKRTVNPPAVPPATGKVPVNTGMPTAGQPGTSAQPVVTAVPQASAGTDGNQPHVSQEPGPSGMPVESQEPGPSGIPVESQEPGPSGIPVESQEPGPSGMPVESQMPGTPRPAETPFVSIAPYESGVPEVPVLSQDTGTYGEAFQLYMASQPGTKIYYTLDGSEPTTDSILYDGSITVVNRNDAANQDAHKNVLTSAENVKKMNIPTRDKNYDYVPLDDEVAKCTVVRVMAVSPDGQKSETLTRSYFVGNDMKEKYAGASVVSLVIDPDKLINYDTGIYALGRIYDEWKTTDEGRKIIQFGEYHNYVANYTQHGKEWERTAVMDYFDADKETLEFSAPVGVRLHGGASRMYGQKSMNIYFREEYGQKNLKYELLPNDLDASGKQIKKYKSFMLRNGGNDTEYSKIRDVFIQNQVADRSFAIQAVKPCVVFLNGEYWGLYNLTEKYGDNNIEENFGVNKDDVIIMKEGEVDEGKDEDWALYSQLWSYANKDFTDEAVYEEFCKIMDIDSFADFYATEIYIANNDWNPTKNYQLWRTRTVEEGNPYADGKWRYLLYDTEFSMGLYGSNNASTNSYAKAVKEDALFAAVMKNKGFQEKFIATIQEIGSVNFNYDACAGKLDEYTKVYKPLMQDFYTRFYGKDTWLRGKFDDEVKTMKNFIKDRYDKIIPCVEAVIQNN